MVTRIAMLGTRSVRQRAGELACEIPLILSNHPTLERVAESFRIPYYCLPVSPDTNASQEKQILDLCARHHVGLVVLARYIQVLTEEFIHATPPVINIHHGFLPRW